MPKKAADKRPSWEADFINCNLDKAAKEQLLKWDLKGEQTFDVISKLIDDGYKLSISADKSHDCVGAYLTSPDRGDGTRKSVLSARGPDLFGSLRAIAFKHSIILSGDWGNEHGDWGDGAWG